MSFKVKLGISARHVHLSQEDHEKLFGEGTSLHGIKDLGQPGEFACEEKVDLVSDKGTLKGIRVIGPIRGKTQVELAMADARVLRIEPPVRESGQLEGSCGIKLVGPKGEVTISEGVIIAARHMHLDTQTAEKNGFKDKEFVKIRIPGERGLVFEQVLVRVKDTYAPEFHIDTDEGNACLAYNDQMVEVFK